MIMLDQIVVAVALPSMSRDLPLSPTGEQWVVKHLCARHGGPGRIRREIGDWLGGVTTFRCGVAVFFIASMACGLAPHGGDGRAVDHHGPGGPGRGRGADGDGVGVVADRVLAECPGRSGGAGDSARRTARQSPAARCAGLAGFAGPVDRGCGGHRPGCAAGERLVVGLGRHADHARGWCRSRGGVRSRPAAGAQPARGRAGCSRGGRLPATWSSWDWCSSPCWRSCSTVRCTSRTC